MDAGKKRKDSGARHGLGDSLEGAWEWTKLGIQALRKQDVWEDYGSPELGEVVPEVLIVELEKAGVKFSELQDAHHVTLRVSAPPVKEPQKKKKKEIPTTADVLEALMNEHETPSGKRIVEDTSVLTPAFVASTMTGFQDRFPHVPFDAPSITMEFPSKHIGALIGKGGETINQIRHKAISHIQVIETGLEFAKITIRGNCQEAEKMLLEAVREKFPHLFPSMAAASGYVLPAPGAPLPNGSWQCLLCNNVNYFRRMVCNSCKAPKPVPANVGR